MSAAITSACDVGWDGATFIATNDLAGLTRGRALPPGAPAHGGTGWVPADLALDAFGSLAADNVFGSTGDLRLSPVGAGADLLDDTGASIRLVLSEITNLDGTPWHCCPRTFARKALDRLRERTGLTMVVAIEHEFLLEGLPPTAPFSFERLRRAEPFGSQLLKTLSANGFEPENWLPEFGADQFEVTLAPAEALLAADRAILVREIVRDLARRHGLRASFTPLRDVNGSGNGAHIHFSLRDRNGNFALYDAAAPAHMSLLGRKFAQGVLQHARAITAVCAPTVSSYVRLQPGRWSVGGVFLGEHNREALLRICPTSGTDEAAHAAQYNLEFRAADGACNPWLAVGMLAHAGLAGIEEAAGDCAIWPAEAAASDIECDQMPRDLQEALLELTTNRQVAQWMPEDLLTTYVQVRRSEIASLAGQSDANTIKKIADVY